MNKITAVTFESPLSLVSGEVNKDGRMDLDLVPHNTNLDANCMVGLTLATATALRDVINALLPACSAE